MMVSIVAFEGMGIATALPEVARDLDGLSAYGWGFSAFMLASVAGNVTSGQIADGRGPVRPFLAGVTTFAAGCALGAAADSWPMLLAGRAVQGAGVGAVSALVYVAVARAYPEVLYGRMMALLSSAWVLPSLVGPAVSGFVAEHFGWRWVFLMLLPLLPVALLLALPGLRSLERAEQERPVVANRLPRALAVIGGMGLLLGGLELDAPVALAAAVAAGAAIGAPALRRLLPAGTLRVRRGLPSGVAVRGLVAVAFLGCAAFLPLGLTRVRGLSLPEAGLIISAGSLSWSLGSFIQGRLDRQDDGTGRGGRVVAGLAVLLCGIGVSALGVLATDLTVLVVAAGWVVAGLGVGLAYPSIGALALGQAPAGAEGGVSSALQLVETIGVALFTGVGGAMIAAGANHGWDAATAIGAIFAAGATAALAALLVGRRVSVTRARA